MFNAGEVKVKAYLAPTQNFPNGPGLRYGISFDDEPVQNHHMHAGKTHRDWQNSVSDYITIMTSVPRVEVARQTYLKILGGSDPGVVLQKLVIETGEVKPITLGRRKAAGLKIAE